MKTVQQLLDESFWGFMTGRPEPFARQHLGAFGTGSDSNVDIAPAEDQPFRMNHHTVQPRTHSDRITNPQTGTGFRDNILNSHDLPPDVPTKRGYHVVYVPLRGGKPVLNRKNVGFAHPHHVMEFLHGKGEEFLNALQDKPLATDRKSTIAGAETAKLEPVHIMAIHTPHAPEAHPEHDMLRVVHSSHLQKRLGPVLNWNPLTIHSGHEDKFIDAVGKGVPGVNHEVVLHNVY